MLNKSDIIIYLVFIFPDARKILLKNQSFSFIQFLQFKLDGPTGLSHRDQFRYAKMISNFFLNGKIMKSQFRGWAQGPEFPRLGYGLRANKISCFLSYLIIFFNCLMGTLKPLNLYLKMLQNLSFFSQTQVMIKQARLIITEVSKGPIENL